jgi:mannose-6-phosphate isomerase-like protein (cupin superfamily)
MAGDDVTNPGTDTEKPAPRLLIRNEADVPERVALGAVHARGIFRAPDAGFESSLVAVLRNRIAAGEVNERHVHDDVEKVYYVLQGEAEIGCGPWQQRARAGDFIFFPAAIPHQIRSLGPDDLEFIVIQAKTLDTPRGLVEE